MGQDASKIAALANESEDWFSPPLGAPNPENPLVYFDVQLGRYGDAIKLGRVVMELKMDVCPRTAENFRQLAMNTEVGKGYNLSRFHRIIPGFMCQGGDFTNDNGTGGRSIYGNKFEDENFTLKHLGAGVLSMANAGPNTNGSQFFLCVAPTPWLDGKHCVFGQVVSGMNVVRAMEACGNRSGDTAFDVIIGACGELPKGTEDGGGDGNGKSSRPSSVAAAISGFTLPRTRSSDPLLPPMRQRRIAPLGRNPFSASRRNTTKMTRTTTMMVMMKAHRVPGLLV